jgi:hypothetical protein
MKRRKSVALDKLTGTTVTFGHLGVPTYYLSVQCSQRSALSYLLAQAAPLYRLCSSCPTGDQQKGQKLWQGSNLHDHLLPLDLTIYGAIHQHEMRKKVGTLPSSTMWQGVYTVKSVDLSRAKTVSFLSLPSVALAHGL